MPDNHNTISTTSPESSPNDDSGPWGKEYKDSVPPFRGERSDAPKDDKIVGYEHLVSTPDYLTDINPERWEQIVETSAQFSQDFPDSVFMGGTALRLFYAAETGELPFGEGSGDLDTFVPAESLAKYRDNLPDGYEIVDTGENKDDRICVRTPSGEEVDVFGWSEDYEPTEIEVDGQTVRVESLTSQILTRVHLAETSDLLDDLSDDEHVDTAKRDKYGFYAQKLLEVVDTKPELIDESKLPDNWHDILLVMSTKGEHGVQLDEDPTITAAREQAIREAMAEKAAREERIHQARERFKTALFDYFQQNHNSSHPAELPVELAEPLAGYENIVMNRLVIDQTPEGFMQGIMAAIGPDAVKEVSKRVNKTVE